MKQMRTYRLDEVAVARLESMSKFLDMSKTDVLEELVNFGFDLNCDFLNKRDGSVSVQRFVERWRERYIFYDNPPKE